jgi:hypothetical protein
MVTKKKQAAEITKSYEGNMKSSLSRILKMLIPT